MFCERGVSLIVLEKYTWNVGKETKRFYEVQFSVIIHFAFQFMHVQSPGRHIMSAGLDLWSPASLWLTNLSLYSLNMGIAVFALPTYKIIVRIK